MMVLNVPASVGEVVWKTEDSDIARIDQSGNVTGASPGSTKVIASAGEETATCEVTVFGLLLPDQVLVFGETKEIEISPTPSNEPILWTSEDSKIAVVDESGNVTGVSPGITTVTASISGGKASCQITVTGTIPHSMNLEIGETRQVQLSPAQDGVLWTSADKNIASVDGSGNVTGVAFGKTTIHAVVAGKEVECIVTVAEDISSQRTATVSGLISHLESFSPDGSMFVSVVGRVMSSSVKRVMDLEGNAYDLPYSPVDYEVAGFGEVSWLGTKLVYSVAGWEPGTAIYLYDWADHTAVNIAEDFNWDKYGTRLYPSPVFSSENIISMLLPDGLWNYDLKQKRWSHKMLQIPEGGRVTWSPDFSKVAWLEYDVDQERLVVLDLNSEETETIIQRKGIAGFAWSEDSTSLAVLGFDWEGTSIYYPLTIHSLEGEVLLSFTDPGNSFHGDILSTELTWVPGQEKVAYNTEDVVVIRDLATGRRWLLTPPAIPPEMAEEVQGEFMTPSLTIQHTWLKNGNLVIAHTYAYHGPSYGVMEVYSLDWEKWSSGQ